MNLYLADDCEQSFAFFKQLIEEEPAWQLLASAKAFEPFISDLFKFEPDVILTSIAFLALLDEAQREQISGTLPRSVILAISDGETLEELRAALKLGARDLLPVGRDKDHVRRVIERAVAEETRRAEYLLKQASFSTVAGSTNAPIGQSGSPSGGQLITLLHAKGGVGQTFVACHLCSALASFSQANVALVDLGTPYADLTTLLDPPTDARLPTYADLVPIIDELDRTSVDTALWTHPAGFRVLFSPHGSPSDTTLPESFLERLLETLVESFDIVVVDTARSPNGLADAAAARATTVFLVLTPDVPAVRDTQFLIEHLLASRLSRDRLKLILNRSRRQVPLGPDELERVFSLPVATALPADHGAADRFENGGQLLTEYTELDVMRSVLDLAGQLYPFEPPSRRTWVTRLRAALPNRLGAPSGSRHPRA